jgi:CheY-like chemotaxis protein
METLAQNLAWAEAEAQASSRAKSQFLAVMSHEIRTPLNGVLAVAEIIERRLRQEELRPYVRTMLNSGETLLRLLTDALDLSRAEAGSMKLEEEASDLGAIFADLDALWRSRAETQGLDFTVELCGELDDWVLVDEVRLKQVCNNLIGNALKFTEAGAVRVRAELRRTGLYANLICTISDTGPGIAAGELESIFKPFSTGAERRRGAGAGLGLAICEQIVAAMGGSISVRSDLGAGSAFTIDLQLFSVPRPAAAAAAPPAEGLATPLHVLVVDDNATNRLVAGTLLEIFGCTYQAVEDGAQAVALTGAAAFDAILMDIQMPQMDGVQATRAIRDGGGRNRKTPIIALTANADPADAADYLAAGMDAVVEKPLKPADLLRALSGLPATAPAANLNAA